MIATALQAYIVVTAIAALACISDWSPRMRLAGYLIGLAGQPAWLVTTWWAEQWGLFAVSIVYTALYARGAWVHRRPSYPR